ncbi:heavy-metal-associated domain-containing protein [Sediminicola luteus]|uniref:Heavy metal transporter n=1 Tax=Sediminicola luteus TaxID=319238 RepID=A0A2A4GB78_9FLAO|nr:heavy-metal-associated domain-containing protein [Sediminicola luteus]PCE65857.1 heavy metal transporter [Sediminicola luteus]
MKTIYTIEGMTCGGCVASVTEKLESFLGEGNVKVALKEKTVTINHKDQLDFGLLQNALAPKYTLLKNAIKNEVAGGVPEDSKWKQLRPLFLIFFYLFSTAFLLNRTAWDTSEAMLDFMGLFYIVFAFFKFLDLKGFPESFAMYDPLAKRLRLYGWVYPFLETALGLMFLMRFQVQAALWITVFILGLTTFGVTRTLLDKKKIRCACLGTALKLPMTEATFIENAIMLLMAFWMLF